MGWVFYVIFFGQRRAGLGDGLDIVIAYKQCRGTFKSAQFIF